MVLVVPGCKVEPPARVNSKKVHLTFAGLWPGELTHASILSEARNWAQTRHGLREYLIGCEKHVDPTIPGRDEHFHVYLHFGKAVDLPDWQRSTSFDLHGQNRRCLHPQIQQVGRSAADRERVIRYGMKEGDYAGEIDPPLAVDPGRDEASEDEEDEDDNDDGNKGPAWASMLNRATTVQQGMQLLAAQATTPRRMAYTPTLSSFTLTFIPRPTSTLSLSLSHSHSRPILSPGAVGLLPKWRADRADAREAHRLAYDAALRPHRLQPAATQPRPAGGALRQHRLRQDGLR